VIMIIIEFIVSEFREDNYWLINETADPDKHYDSTEDISNYSLDDWCFWNTHMRFPNENGS
jgi:hypothetical protein